ncbi:TRAP transporter substrate-binding protein [Anaerotalea alkaliphila]|uniref:TRAP transporter substrate-binding protein n=1 Tax=Anaerotalea alkaliphila TaxID=2662126 RepID=A0A7X5KM31_9FIRM|nr:TRAP transporter substrate-binding protein [Anaerotalea alkaliphila]NDL67516.1 TRAP transporter substrate-binding protein [Anaerotalea alkaliphila]
MKKILSIALMAILALSVAGCGQKTDTGTGSEAEAVTMKLAHNLSETHTVHLALQDFADRVKEKTGGEVEIQIFPNGQLGSETEVLEQLQAGAVDFTKVSATALSVYDAGYDAFSLPYIFRDQDHYYKSMEADVVQDLYERTSDKGFLGLTFYTSGARSFYTIDRPILTPADLRGLKVRVMGFKSQTDLMSALGGTAVGMPYGDIYTSLQSGIIDGAESNETALTTGKHGEVAKVFSLDEHTMIPDILVMSAASWGKLTEEQQALVKEAAVESTEYHKPLWDEAIEQAVVEAKAMGVEFHEVDKAPFVEATKDMVESYKNEFPEIKVLLDGFDQVN